MPLDDGDVAYYKIDHCRGALDAIKHCFRRSRSSRAWRALRRLAALGFDVPEPLAHGERRFGPLLRASYLITRGVGGAAPLAAILRTPAAAAALPAFARLLRRLHDAGVYHADVQPANVLARADDRGTTLWLVDADRTRFLRRVPERLRWKNLAQALAHIEPATSTALRLRLLYAYDASLRDAPRAERRRVIEGILALRRTRWVR